MRIIISLIILTLIYFYGILFIEIIKGISLADSFQSVFIYALAGSTVIFLIFMKSGSYFAIFEHELTHNLFALLTLQKPTGFHVEKGAGGYFQFEGKGNVLMTLAPYFFLTISFIALLFYDLLKALYYIYYNYFFIALSLFTGYHTSSTIKETRISQPDIQKYGP